MCEAKLMKNLNCPSKLKSHYQIRSIGSKTRINSYVVRRYVDKNEKYFIIQFP